MGSRGQNMPRDDSAQDRLWTLIEARKQDRDGSGASERTAVRNGQAASDAPLVDMLYRAVRAPEGDLGQDAGTARSLLQAAIVADSASRRFRRTRWLPRFSGARQL